MLAQQFWMDCRMFQELSGQREAQATQAEFIHLEYIARGSRKMVNLKGQTNQALIKDIQEGNIYETVCIINLSWTLKHKE